MKRSSKDFLNKDPFKTDDEEDNYVCEVGTATRIGRYALSTLTGVLAGMLIPIYRIYPGELAARVAWKVIDGIVYGGASAATTYVLSKGMCALFCRRKIKAHDEDSTHEYQSYTAPNTQSLPQSSQSDVKVVTTGTAPTLAI